MRRIAILLITCTCLISLAAAQDVQFNYNGRVNVMGSPFNGEGHFKLTLTNYDGTITYWANDGVTAGQISGARSNYFHRCVRLEPGF